MFITICRLSHGMPPVYLSSHSPQSVVSTGPLFYPIIDSFPLLLLCAKMISCEIWKHSKVFSLSNVNMKDIESKISFINVDRGTPWMMKSSKGCLPYVKIKDPYTALPSTVFVMWYIWVLVLKPLKFHLMVLGFPTQLLALRNE